MAKRCSRTAKSTSGSHLSNSSRGCNYAPGGIALSPPDLDSFSSGRDSITLTSPTRTALCCYAASPPPATCWPPLPQVQFFPEAPMAARQQVLCMQCDKSEEYCTCDKYCTICKSLDRVRLAVDGLYYCPDCREACDVAWASSL